MKRVFIQDLILIRAFMLLILLSCVLAVTSAIAKDSTYIGTVQIIRSPTGADAVRGNVFLDTNRNAKLDAGEPGIPGVMISNGREVVVTDADGAYQLPAYDDMNVFMTKPAGYTNPVNQLMVPQFHYIHKVAGSPPLRYGGIDPTGPLPQAINFPLIEDPVGDTFQCLVFGDPQPYTHREMGYVRETAGKMLATRDNRSTECLIFEGDIMGDDLSLYPRFKQIISVGNVPQYFVGGNHDLDFDATSDAHSFDTFRREWGPEYYSFDIGKVHFVVLDNVRYPCNGVDAHPFCDLSKKPTYNGIIHDRQLEWLRNDLAHVPGDKLIVLNAHIPFVTFTRAQSQQHQTDNLAALYDIIGDRPALGLTGHTHTTEQILPGESFAGWAEHTGTGAAKFHQIITGALSGSWWTGDLNDQGIPHATQRLGSPRGYYQIQFDGTSYVDTYLTFGDEPMAQMHASFNTPRFRHWATKLFAYVKAHRVPSDILPPVTINDLGDMHLLTLDDLQKGTWVAINVWNGSQANTVSVSIDDGATIQATRTQAGKGEAVLNGPAYADPLALAKQATQGRMTFRSETGGDKTAGFTTWKRHAWKTKVAGPFKSWMLTNRSSHLWKVDLPKHLPTGVHQLKIVTTDRYRRSFRKTLIFEVVTTLPELD